MKFFELTEITFDEQHATVEFDIDFWAKIKGMDTKISYSGEGSMTFEYEYGDWHVRTVELPVNG